jgi:hypothetical protein
MGEPDLSGRVALVRGAADRHDRRHGRGGDPSGRPGGGGALRPPGGRRGARRHRPHRR